MDCGVKMRPSPEEFEEWGPEFKLRWESYFKDAPDKAVLWMGQIAM